MADIDAMGSSDPEPLTEFVSDDPAEQRLEVYAASGLYPNISPCPVGCKFCYERSLPEFYPKLKVARVKKRSLKQFEFYADQLERYKRSAVPAYPVMMHEGSVVYHSASDFFAQGMSTDQLEKVVAANTVSGEQPYLSTMGKDFTAEQAQLLTEKHPEAFRVRLSVLTYNDEIKRNLIPKWGDSSEMRKITTILRDAHIYLLAFGREQTLSDLREINALANLTHKPCVGIAVVHYTKLHPPIVKQYAEDGFADFKELVMDIMRDERELLTNIADLHFQHPSEAFSFRYRNVLRGRVAPLLLDKDDLVLCSKGALDVLSKLVVRNGARVVPVPDGLGGSTTFTTTLCTADFIRELRPLLDANGQTKGRVLVPAPVWWVNGGKNCLGSGSVEELCEAFPGVEIVPIEIPEEIIHSRLTLRDCYDYFNTDFDKSRDVLKNAHSKKAIEKHLDEHEQITDMGFVRRIHVAPPPPPENGKEGSYANPALSDAIDPTNLSVAERGKPLLVSYDEILVELSDAYPRETDTPKNVFRIEGEDNNAAESSILVRRAITRAFPLRGEFGRAMFTELFIDKTPLADVLASLPDADGRAYVRSMYEALGDLEVRH